MKKINAIFSNNSLIRKYAWLLIKNGCPSKISVYEQLGYNDIEISLIEWNENNCEWLKSDPKYLCFLLFTSHCLL